MMDAALLLGARLELVLTPRCDWPVSVGIDLEDRLEAEMVAAESLDIIETLELDTL